jgi:hypothetical protein
MNQTKPCCRSLPGLSQVASPFDAVIALGYYDGPEDGMVRCGGCGREYRLQLLDSRIESDEENETRIFGLSPIPDGSLAEFIAAMSTYQEARSPNWVPLWAFTTDEERARMEDLVDRIFARAKPVELVLASTPWPSGEILSARSIPATEEIAQKDWFSELGLLPVAAKD